MAVALDIRLLAVVGAMTAAALLLFGLFPAWRGSRLTDASWLKEGAGSMGQASRHKWNAARVLPLVQVAMSVVLVMTAIVFTRNLVSIESTDPGFDRRNLVMFDVRPGKSGYSEERLPVFYLNLEVRAGRGARGFAGRAGEFQADEYRRLVDACGARWKSRSSIHPLSTVSPPPTCRSTHRASSPDDIVKARHRQPQQGRRDQ